MDAGPLGRRGAPAQRRRARTGRPTRRCDPSSDARRPREGPARARPLHPPPPPHGGRGWRGSAAEGTARRRAGPSECSSRPCEGSIASRMASRENSCRKAMRPASRMRGKPEPRHSFEGSRRSPPSTSARRAGGNREPSTAAASNARLPDGPQTRRPGQHGVTKCRGPGRSRRRRAPPSRRTGFPPFPAMKLVRGVEPTARRPAWATASVTEGLQPQPSHRLPRWPGLRAPPAADGGAPPRRRAVGRPPAGCALLSSRRPR